MIKFDLSAQSQLKSFRKPTLKVIGMVKNALENILEDFQFIGLGSKLLVCVENDIKNPVLIISENDSSLKVEFPNGQLINDKKSLLKRAKLNNSYLLLVKQEDYQDLESRYFYELINGVLKELGK